MTWSRALPVRLTLLVLVGALLAGCGGEPDPERRVHRWLAAVCDGADIRNDGEPDEDGAADAGGDTLAYASCTRTVDAVEREDEADGEVEVLVEAYVFDDRPGRELINTMDGWESGEGRHMTFAVADLHDGSWGVVFAFTEQERLFDALADQRDPEDWDFVATHRDDGRDSGSPTLVERIWGRDD